jgi:membrane protein
MTAGEIIRRTIAEIDEDNCVGLAAQLAFYFFLALCPALLFLVALMAYLPLDNALNQLLAALGTVAPLEALALLQRQLDQITSNSHSGILTLGFLGALWSSSAATVSIIDALNQAYDITERRPWWRRRLLAILLTLALAAFIVGALTFILTGPEAVTWVAGAFGLGGFMGPVWQLVRWPLMVLFAVFGMDLVYYFAPNNDVRWAWVTPGAGLATALWIASSLAFRYYVTNFGTFNATYGAIGGVAVVLLWFYVSGLAILIGAELNGVIEQDRRRQTFA